MTNDPPKNGLCKFCGRLQPEEQYCYGCEQFICEKCDQNWDVVGKHDVSEHARVTVRIHPLR